MKNIKVNYVLYYYCIIIMYYIIISLILTLGLSLASALCNIKDIYSWWGLTNTYVCIARSALLRLAVCKSTVRICKHSSYI